MRYSNGAVHLREADLVIPGGELFSHRRSYGNQASDAYDGPNGFNWFVSQLPYVVSTGSSVAVVFDSNNPYWFDRSGGSYVPRYGVVGVSLTEDPVAQTLRFAKTAGHRAETTVFNGPDAATTPGQFVTHTDARGITTTVASRTGDAIGEMQRTFTAGGTTTVDSLLYAYVPGTAPAKLQDVTYRRRVGGGAWTAVRRVSFAYYGPVDAHGSLHDLKTATQQQPDGVGGWDDVAVRYYRYYKAGDSAGFEHGLKLHVGPEAYRRMFNAGISVDAADDATVLPYADHYFEYDPVTRSVTKEVAAVCDSCPGGGTTSDVFSYASNPRSPAPGYNVWATKTVQVLPDGSQLNAYSNYAGVPMLRVSVDATGTKKWCTYYRYDADGRVVWEAQPSAVTGYDDAHDDLLNFNASTGLYQYLRDDDGLIRVNEYYDTDDLATGKVKGYLAGRKVRRGQAGTDVPLTGYAYTSHSNAAGLTVYPVWKEIAYPEEGNASRTIVTEYVYDQWGDEPLLPMKRTTKLPRVATDQNGSNELVTVVEEYDGYGNVAKRSDERGVVTVYENDAVLGVVTKETRNYQESPAPGAEHVNLVTEYAHDADGRLVQTLGPAHTAVVDGVAATVRKATWHAYVEAARPASGTWGLDEDRTAEGYATGTGPSYAYTLVNPVTIQRTDKSGRTLDLVTAKRTSGTGQLSAADTFDQGDWQSWRSSQFNERGRLVSERVYHLISTSGVGSLGTNYGQTDYGYDLLERQNRVRTPGGTITRTVWAAPQRVASVWVGTDDTGATDANPAGTGSPNNMVLVTENQYDGGSDSGDDNLTEVTQYASATDTRVTAHGYDWRGRRMSTDGEVDRYEEYSYDNLDRLMRTDLKDTSATGNLIGRSETRYDDLGRVYQTITYAVDPETGAVGNALTANTWYDAAGNVVQHIAAANGQVFTKHAYNALGWLAATYRGYNTSGTSYTQAATVANDTIVEQVENTYDEVGNLVTAATSQRLNDAAGVGALSGSAQPKARVSYRSTWYDAVGRRLATADYGALASFSRPGSIPGRSDTVLVSTSEYDGAGRMWKTIDPAQIEYRTEFDAAGRVTKSIEAYDAVAVADDKNRTTEYTYTPDGIIATITAINGRTGNQTTTYTYGTTLADSGVARNDLRRFVAYPDSAGASDRTDASYNRLGQQTRFIDQRGTVRSFDYDKLGRLLHDRVTTIGSNTDAVVLRISRSYEVRGMLKTVATHNNATAGSGTLLSEAQFDYDHFGQLVTEWQEHGGPVSGTTPRVQYVYASGDSGSNQIRPTSMTYPGGRAITNDYGTARAMDDYLNRVTAIKEGITSLAGYTYLGASNVIRIDCSEPGIRLDLWGGTSGTFSGFDRFGRVIDQRWVTTGVPTDLDRYHYGYDRNSNRLWRQNVVGTPAATGGLDEYFAYDNLNRLVGMQRGLLNGTKSGIDGTPSREDDWTLDPTGNWKSYRTTIGGTTELDHSRASNAVNEITAINETSGPAWVDPAYDAAGNMTIMPKPSDPTQSFTCLYDAWNRLVHVSYAGNTFEELRYDGMGRRILRALYDDGALDQTRHYYFNNAWQLIEERIDASTAAYNTYVWGIRYLDELVTRDQGYAPNVVRHYTCQDANFNVTAATSASGLVVSRWTYEAYGYPTSYNGGWSTGGIDLPTLYCGYEYDSAIGLYSVRHRCLHSRLGIWVQRDAIDSGEGVSLYEYARSGPLARTDPLGLQAALPQEATPLVVGASVARTYSAYEAALAAGNLLLAAALANEVRDALISAGLSEDAAKDWARRAMAEINDLMAKQTAAAAAATAAAAAAAWTANCEALHAAYKAAQKAFSENSCRNAKTCAELMAAIALLAKEIALRAAYIADGCDFIDWFGNGRDKQEKEQAHWGEYRAKLRAIQNCWDRYTELCC